jgi:DNA processing protein
LPDLNYYWYKFFSLEGLSTARKHRIFAKARLNGLTLPQLFQLEKEKIEKIFTPKGLEIYYALLSLNDAEIQQEYQELTQKGTAVIHPQSELYTQILLDLYLDRAPLVLFARGKTELLQTPSLAIVGSREADDDALKIAFEVAEKAASSGWNVVSGYARGVDSSAHKGALCAGGTTTMVLAFGLEKFLPRREVANLQWKDRSLILSQFKPQEGWKNSYGNIRNQLIVGLSSAVIVILAKMKSGTMNTAELALKTGLPLFVLSPHFFSTDSASGNEFLIANGAKEIVSLEGLFEDFAPFKYHFNQSRS